MTDDTWNLNNQTKPLSELEWSLNAKCTELRVELAERHHEIRELKRKLVRYGTALERCKTQRNNYHTQMGCIKNECILEYDRELLDILNHG